jgi:hypothetical protein
LQLLLIFRNETGSDRVIDDVERIKRHTKQQVMSVSKMDFKRRLVQWKSRSNMFLKSRGGLFLRGLVRHCAKFTIVRIAS